MTGKHFSSLLVIALLLISTASAQIYEFQPYSSDYFTKITWDDINRRTAEAAKSSQVKTTQTTPKSAPAPVATLSFKSTGNLTQSKGIEALVSQFGKDQQSTMKSNYAAMITSFNDSVVRLYGIEKNNLATGIAALLTGAYVAYNNKPFPDAWVKPLVKQLEKSMLQDGRLAGAPASDKEAAYHVMVGVGMSLQVAQLELSKKPDAQATARLKMMGAEVFKKLLTVEASRVQFSQTGMSIR